MKELVEIQEGIIPELGYLQPGEIKNKLNQIKKLNPMINIDNYQIIISDKVGATENMEPTEKSVVKP
jgi:hypothetical protein